METGDIASQGIRFPPGFQPESRRSSFQGSPGRSPSSRQRSPSVAHGNDPALEPSPTASSLTVPPRDLGHRRHDSDSGENHCRSRSSSTSGSPNLAPTFIFNSCHITYQGSAGSNPSKLITDFQQGQPYYVAPGIPSPPLSGFIDNDISSPESALDGLHGFSHLSDVADHSPERREVSPNYSSWNSPSQPQRQGSSPSNINTPSIRVSPALPGTPLRPVDMQRSRSDSVNSSLRNSPLYPTSHQRSRSQSFVNTGSSPRKSPRDPNSYWKDNTKEGPSTGLGLIHDTPTPNLLFPGPYTPKLQRKAHERAIYRAIAKKDTDKADISPVSSSSLSRKPKVDPSHGHDWRIQSWDEGLCQGCGYEESYMKCRGCDSFLCVMCYVERYPEAPAFKTLPTLPSQCSNLC